MASEIDTQNPSDLTVCSICFEKFRTPRILPCAHVFCHGCISAYIISSCESKEAPVGFSCPVCRKFVPSPTHLSIPEEWSEGLPVCKILDLLNKPGEKKLCIPCLRENEKEEASDICINCEESLCRHCSKYHKRNLTSKHHVVKSIDEPNVVLQSISSFKNNNCPVHPDKEIEMHCNDHKKVCCSLCISTEHRKCADVTTIQLAAARAKEAGSAQSLLMLMGEYKQKLLRIKKNQEQNLEEVDTASDRISEETKKLRKEINDHLDQLENKHLNELARVTKKGRDILSKTINSVSDGILLNDHYTNVLSNLEDATDEHLMKEYQRVREGFNTLKLQTAHLKEHSLKIESIKSVKDVKTVMDIKCFSSIKVTDTCKDLFEFDIKMMSLSLLFEFIVQTDDVYSGVLSKGRLTLAKFGSSKIGLQQYSLNNGRQTNEYRSPNCLFGLAMGDSLFYATDRNLNCVAVISSASFMFTKTIPVDRNFIPYGICLWNDYLFIACQTAILKYNVQGRFIHCYPVEFNTLFVVVTTPGNIVYCNTYQNCVVATDIRGNQIWKYTDSTLQSPHAIDKDELDNLFVASNKSNSVHILSCDGALIRIIKDIPNPVFMKIEKSSRICSVCSNFRNIKVYRMS